MKQRRQQPEQPCDHERRSLEAIDAALAGTRPQVTDPKSLQMAELAVALRKQRPRPSQEFAERIEQGVATGFAQPAEARRHEARRAVLSPLRRLRKRRPLHKLRRPLPGLAAAASLLLVLGLSVAVLRPDGRHTVDTTAQEPSGALPQAGAPERSTPGAGEIETPLVPKGDAALGARQRRVEVTAALTLAADRGRIQEVADRVVRTTDRHGGAVMRSEITTDTVASNEATFELRVPTAQVKATLAELSTLASVRSRTQSTGDVTGTFVSVSDRLREARAERQGILRRIGHAGSDRELARLRHRLGAVTTRIGELRSSLHSLKERTDSARIDVTIEAKSGSRHPETSGAWGTIDAVRDSLHVMVQSVNFLIRALGVLLPLGLLAMVAWWAGRAALRWRREAALK